MLVNIGKVTKPSEQKQYTNIGRVSDEAQKRISGMNIKLPTLKEMFDNPQQSFSEAAKGNPIPSVYPTKGLIERQQLEKTEAENYAKEATKGDGFEKYSLSELEKMLEEETEKYTGGEKGSSYGYGGNFLTRALDFIGAHDRWESQEKLRENYSKLKSAYENRKAAYTNYIASYEYGTNNAEEAIEVLKERRKTASDSEKASINKKIDEIENGLYGESSVTEYVGNALKSGVNQVLYSIASGGNFIFGNIAKALGFKDNIFDSTNDYYKNLYEKSSQEMSRTGAAVGDKYAIAGQVISGATAALPDAVLAVITGGTSTVPTLGNQATGMLGSVQASLSTMVKNPFYWTSFSRELGTNYDEALENGASEAEATAFALITSTLNAIVEVGGTTGAGGIQTLPDALKNTEGSKSAIWEWIKSSFEEGNEEAVQGVISKLNEMLIYDEDKKLFSLSDEDAVINPYRTLKEAALGTAVGAVLGGGQLTFANIVNAATADQYKNIGKYIKTNSDINGIIDYAKKSVNTNIRAEALKSTPDNISDQTAGKLYSYVCRDINSAINSPESIDVVSQNYKNIVNSTDSDVIIGAASSQYIQRLMEMGTDEKTAQSMVGSIAPSLHRQGIQPDNDIEQPVDSGENAGYNSNIRGEDNGLSDNRTTVGSGQERTAAYSGAEGENGRAWGETKEAFAARAQRNANKAGRGKRVLLKHGSGSLAYTEKSADNTQASRAAERLKKAGVKAVYCDGDIETNENGVTTRHSEAITAPDGTVYISSRATLSDLDIASHELVHSEERKGAQAYVEYENIICENLLLNSDAFRNVCRWINENHYGGKYDIEDVSSANNFIREIAAYVNEFTITEPSRVDSVFSGMFEDWGAVKAAAEKFNRDTGADFTESAFLAPEADNRAELPDGVRSETVTLTRDGKRRRHLNRAEQEYVKKIAGLFGVDVVFENVKEKTGIAADSYYDGSNNIHMDFSVADPLNILIKHELTHFGEESREYNDFVRLVKDSKVFRDWINSKISGEKNISAKSAQYRQQIMDRYENAGEKLTVTGADGEMTANFVADTLFTDNGSGLDALIRQAEAKDRPVLIQWIIDFVKSVKSLFKGQYVPPEVLRLERKYVQMLKDAQSTEGQKNTAENNGVRYSIAVESNNSSIKQQLREHLNEVNAMSPVAEVQYTPTNKKNLRTQALQEFKKIGYKVERQGFGIIEIGDKQIEKSLEYITTDGERAALLAVPKVLKRGIEISGHKDHKGRSYGTITIAAPVSINGKIGDIAVVVKVTGKNRYSTHRILMPDGSEFIFEENKNTEPTSSDMLAQKSDQGTDISSVSDIIVPQSDTSVNTSISEKAEDSTMKFSIPEDQSALLDRYDRGEISRQEYLEESNKNWQRAVEEYGTIPEGEAPYDNIPVPTAVEDGRETKRFVRTVIEGGALPKRMIEDLGSEILAGNMSYEPVSDKSAQEYADKQINTGQAEQKWNDTVNKKSIITKDDIAVGEKLLIKAIKEHDTKRVLELTAELSDIFTRAGQTVQAASMFKKMTGMGKLVAVQRFVNSLNNDLEQKYGKKAPVLRIDEILAEQLTQIPQGEDPQNIYTEVIKDIASQVPVTFLEKLNAWRYLAMLFNPKTHIRNIVGNGIFIPSVRIKDYAAAALESAFVKNGERTKSIVIDKKYKDFADKMLKDNLVKQSLKEGRKTDELQLAEYRRIFKNEFLEKLRQLNFGALEAEDFFAKTRHFRRALAGYLQANKADLNNIDSGLLARAQEYAIKEAAKATFNDASEIANAISKFAGKNKATDVLINGILPFKRTPINIVKRGIEYSPIGLTATIIKGSLDLKNGKITAAEYIDGLGAGISGSVVFALGALLASLGMATGGFGSDDEDKFKKLNGEQEYSLVINGKSYTVDWAVPAAIPFFIGVETFNSLFDDNEDFTLSDITEVMWNSLEPITNLSMLSGVQDMISSVQYAAENRSIQSIAGAAVSSYISQFVPSIFGAVSRTIDDTRYSSYTDKNSQLSSFTQGIINSIRAKLPNVISKRPAYIDEWGRTESTGSVIERLFSNFISPGYFSEEQYTALDNEIQRLADSTGENSVYPGYAPKSFEVNGETKYLTAEEYQQYATAKGQYSLQYISEFMSSAAYNRLNDGERVSVIENLYKYANAKAKAEVSDYDITKSFKTVSQWEKSGRSPVIYYISLAIK